MDLRHIRYFLGVVEAGGIARAAATMRLAQPALSRQLRDLEDELGAPLVERGSRGTRLTAVGERWAAGARGVLAAAERVVERARAVERGMVGRVVVATSRAALGSGHLARAIDELRVIAPGIAIELLEADPEEAAAALRGGRAEMALWLSTGEPVADLAAIPLTGNPIECAILPSDHPLAGSSQVELGSLIEIPLLVAPGSTIAATVSRIMGALARLHDRPVAVVECSSSDAIWTAVAAGGGWSVGPRSFRERPPAGVVAVPLRGFRVETAVTLFHRLGPPSPVHLTVIAVMRAVFEGRAVIAADLLGTPVRRRATRSPGLPRAFELRLVRAFVTAVEAGTVAGAARRIGLSQPAVSRQIQRLERALGSRLVVRGARGVSVTEVGRVVHEDGVVLLAAVESAIAAARSLTRPARLGVVPPALALGLVRRGLEILAGTHPDLTVTVSQVPTPEQAEAIRTGAIDIGIAHGYPGLGTEGGIARHRLLDDALECALFATNHPLAESGQLTATDLSDWPLLFMNRAFHPKFYDAVMSALARIGLTPRIEAAYNGLQVVWALAAEGKGWAVGARSMTTTPPPGLRAIPIEGFSVPWGFDLLSRVGEPDPGVAATVEAFRRMDGGVHSE